MLTVECTCNKVVKIVVKNKKGFKKTQKQRGRKYHGRH